jgi:tetratricopeptide (TPR) repeat protein
MADSRDQCGCVRPAIPYLAIIELLKSYFHIASRNDVSARRDKVTDKLRTLGQTLESSLPALFTLLDVPVEDAAWQALDPSQRRQQLLDAIKRLLVRESQIQRILLVAENLHWIDGETQALLDMLVEGLATARLLLLVTYRPEYHHGWTSKTYYTQLRLDPLPPGPAQELLNSLLGDDVSLVPLMQNLLQRTEGNPFFLEESVQTLVETRVLIGERGAYRLTQPLRSVQVPATIQVILAARLERLPPQEKRLLQTAAVIGLEVPFALVQAVAELPEEELRRGLAHLQAAEFIYETNLWPELAYTFKHALTHEVAYASLVQERRRVLHGLIVEAMEALDADRLAEQVDRLAHHAVRGEVWDKAVAYCRQAGAKALSRSAYREAVTSFEQALDALHRLPTSPATQAQAIDLRLDLRSALWPLGEHRRSFVCLQDAEAFAEDLGDPHRLGWVSAALLANFWQASDLDHALASGQRALALAATLEDVGLTVFVQHYLGHVYRSLGDYRRAMDFYRKNVARLRGEPFHERFGLPGIASVTSCSALVISLAECGAFAEGRNLAEEGVRIAEACDHAFSRATAYWAMGWQLLRQGDFHQAIPTLERALDLTQVAHIGLSVPPGASLLGAAYALAGRTTEALPLLEQAVEQAVAMGFVLDHALRVVRLGEAYLFAGRMDEAGTQAQRALEFSRAHREQGHEAYALRLLGEIAAHQDPTEVEPAEHHYRQALALAEELGMRPLMAHCHLGLGTLYLKKGRREQAHAELATAIELYHAMDMTFWLPQAEAAMAQAG